MGVLVVSENLVIQSHKGPYAVHFTDGMFTNIDHLLADNPHFIVDANIKRLYGEVLAPILEHANTIVIEATEENKSIERIIPVFEKLVANNVRRSHTLIAIGGGIIQDITCFIASTLLRGLTWRFVPTTLLSQADSCIGSKSSINLGKSKNILGTFNPAKEVFVATAFLDTLEHKEVLSGVGEILKVHAIDGADAFDQLAASYDKLFSDRPVLLDYIHRALLIKKRFIEVDEFDVGVRNIFNYGHSFGHAIESATNFGIPHGIAISMGMDIANHISSMRGLVSESHYQRMHGVMQKNYSDYAQTDIPADDMYGALKKDKKNTSTSLVVILPVGDEAAIERVEVTPDDTFRKQFDIALGAIQG